MSSSLVSRVQEKVSLEPISCRSGEPMDPRQPSEECDEAEDHGRRLLVYWMLQGGLSNSEHMVQLCLPVAEQVP